MDIHAYMFKRIYMHRHTHVKCMHAYIHYTHVLEHGKMLKNGNVWGWECSSE